MPRFAPAAAVLTAAILLLLAGGCSSDNGHLVNGLHLSATTVVPSGAAPSTIKVTYNLTRPAMVGVYLVSASGERLYLRRDESRPVAGQYTLNFNGAYEPDPGTDERRVLIAGAYNLVVEAGNSERSEQISAQVQVLSSDTALPGVENLTLYPETLSPNGDGVDDSLRVTYRTSKLATISLYLISETGKRYLLERQEREAQGEHSTVWDGQIANQLLPSGSYRFVAESQDAAGNVLLTEKTLRIDSASLPDAHILAVNFDPPSLALGGLVKATIRVRNSGNTVLRTQEPDPGYIYDSQENYLTTGGGGFTDKKGVFRVGVDWAGAPGTVASVAKYPYRWGFGKDLQPGEEVTVVGYIRLNEKQDRLWLYAGLVQEQVRFWDSVVGQTVVEIAR